MDREGSDARRALPEREPVQAPLPDLGAPPDVVDYVIATPDICLSCNAVAPKSLADHAPNCQLVKRKAAERKDIERMLQRYKPKNVSGHQRLNKPGNCKACGEKVTSLLSHLRTCKGRPAPDAPADPA